MMRGAFVLAIVLEEFPCRVDRPRSPDRVAEDFLDYVTVCLELPDARVGPERDDEGVAE